MPKNGSQFVKFIAFDTSTDVMSIALTDGARVWQHTGPGGAKASTTLIPAILALLAEAGLALGDLQAIAFGRGPGSFTGLRTACAVAQGLAFGAKDGVGIPVLPMDTLMAVAEEARLLHDCGHITALLDARMDEMYVQRYTCSQGVLTPLGDCELIRPEALASEPGTLYAGNVFEVYRGRLPEGLTSAACLPTATAMLRLAPRLAASGHCVAADQALPLYVRDKVAQTTAEREQIKALKLQNLPTS
ncbi:MAG: tRNA (adenosine(37)-N6)-threonylcarbamoyltransferase complex dimerization subunit type 1 TsaB [Polaromonas sp.]